MSERYKVVEGSKSAHCRFEATVVDTQISSLPFHDERGWVCECFGMESAQKIADALNAAQQSAPDVEALVEALKVIQRAATHDSIQEGTALGSIAAICDDTLAAHRKGEDV